MVWFNGFVKTVLVCVLLLLLLAGLSCASDTPSLEEQAQSIDKLLMCPICPAETIDQSQAEIAAHMRALVRQKLAAGETKEQILAYFVDRYEKGVLAEPPQEGFNLVVWIVPPIALAAGLALFWIAARHLAQKGRPRPAESIASEELAPYLEEVDREFLAFEGAQVTTNSDLGERGA
ncbi:MAG: cytochrome c-type biogenesis protein CcmH [Dehalococcoidia bacterium]